MKGIQSLSMLMVVLLFASCIQDDIIDDRVDEQIRFDNPITEIQLGDSYQLETSFFNNVGMVETASFLYSSSNPGVAQVSSTGLLHTVALGTTTIRAQVTLTNGSTIMDSFELSIVENEVDPVGPALRSGTIVTTSSYVLEGDFTLGEIENTDDLDLQIASNYRASNSLPGLYLYLSNNPNSISGALELGPVQVFDGAHSYDIQNVGINEYKYLLYWCKPFSVKVGHGEIND